MGLPAFNCRHTEFKSFEVVEGNGLLRSFMHSRRFRVTARSGNDDEKPQKSAGSVSLCRPGSEKTTLNRCEGRSFSESFLDLKILWGTCKF